MYVMQFNILVNFDICSGEASASDSEVDKKSESESSPARKKKKSETVEDMDTSSNAAKGDGEIDEPAADEEAGSDAEGQIPKKRTKERSRSAGSEITSGGSELEHEDEGKGPEEGEEGEGEKKTKKDKKPLLPLPGETKKKILFDEDELPQLHRTASIFLRNLSPTITKQEVESLCKKYPGFLRVAIADPQPDKRFSRRAWVTFKRNVNIKGKCSDD